MNANHASRASLAARRRLLELSRELAESGRYVALESDTWFLHALHEAHHGARQLGTALAPYVFPRWMKRWVQRSSAYATPRARLLRVLRAEGKRARLDVDGAKFEAFSTGMADLLTLVFSGALRIEDISFDAGDATDPADRASAPAMAHTPAPASESPSS